jgi:SOS-response transcriptional repressor LexA
MDIAGFWERTNSLIKLRKTTQRVLSKECGFTERRIETLVSSERFPDAIEAFRIAEELGTTVEYLITGKEINGFSQKIIPIAQKIAGLDPKDRQDILDFIDIKLKKGKKGGKTMEAITVSEPEPAYITDITSIPIREEVIDNVIFHEWGVIEIPLLGTTAAGQPIDFGDIDPDPPTRPWAAGLVTGDPADYYCVTVRGESMTEADIKDGDHALLRHAQRPRNGEIMLVRHDNSSTLKRIKVIEGKDGQEEVYICWEDGSRRKVRLSGEGYEIQGLLVAIERKPGKR